MGERGEAFPPPEAVENAEQKAGQEYEEKIMNTDALFVLAHGKPPEDKLMIEARLRTLAAVEASKVNPSMRVAFVGGHVEDEKFDSTSKQMADYFKKKNFENKGIVILDRSNNTVGNIREIFEYLELHPEIKQVSVMSSETHLNRVQKILKQLDVEADLVPSEPFAKQRSKHHKNFVERYQRSFAHRSHQAVDRLMIAYMKLDPNYDYVEKWRRIVRTLRGKIKK